MVLVVLALQSYKNTLINVYLFLQIIKLARLKGGVEFQWCTLYTVAVDCGDSVVTMTITKTKIVELLNS